jgi:hypothetical protein
VAASAAYGKGHVFWEGLNLPFHLDTFKASPESQFLVRALLSTAATTTSAAAPTRSTATYVNPMSWRISTSGARGVLFKEQDAPGWHATANGKPLTTYAAGPGMVWVPLASGDPVTVALRYRLSVLDEAGYAGSVLTVLGMAVLLASGRLRSLLQRRASALLDGAEVGVERELLPLG